MVPSTNHGSHFAIKLCILIYLAIFASAQQAIPADVDSLATTFDHQRDAQAVQTAEKFFRLLAEDGFTDELVRIIPGSSMDSVRAVTWFWAGEWYYDSQDTPGKRNIITTVAMRLLLDRASTVDQAIDMLKGYNLCQDSPAGGNYHFFIADAQGDYAIVEYVYDTPDFSGRPNLMQVLNGNDTLRCVTNFYVSPDMERHPDINEPTSHTQWSSLYNLSSRTLDVAILKEYNKVSHFTF